QSYVCIFGSSSSAASWTQQGVSCALPSLRSSSDLPSSLTELLALSTSTSSYRIVEYNFTIYNCGAFMTCSSCSASETGCDWCIESHKCVSSGKCSAKKATECVHIKQPSQLMIPKGNSQEISFAVAHLDRLPREESYSCRVVLNGTTVHSKAKLAE
ncbi:plexin repeat-containing domain protein, partial [Cooperia oncophora]